MNIPVCVVFCSPIALLPIAGIWCRLFCDWCINGRALYFSFLTQYFHLKHFTVFGSMLAMRSGFIIVINLLSFFVSDNRSGIRVAISKRLPFRKAISQDRKSNFVLLSSYNLQHNTYIILFAYEQFIGISS